MNKPLPNTFCTFLDAYWVVEAGKGEAGFFVLDANGQIFLANSRHILVVSELDAHMKALKLALRCTQMENINLHKVFISSLGLLRLVEGVESESNWRLQEYRLDLQRLLLESDHPEVAIIPRQWNRLASSLAGRGFKATQLSLFHQGMERPRWLMRMIEWSGYNF